MKLNYFICLLLVIGSCQKMPTKPIPNPSAAKCDYDSAIQNAFDLASKTKDTAPLWKLKHEIEKTKTFDASLARVYRRIGLVYNEIQQPDSAIEATKTALSILQKSSQRHPSDSAKCQLNIGIYYLLADDFYSLDSAKVYLGKALSSFQELKDISNIFNTQNNLMRFHIKLGDYAKATLIEKSIESLAYNPVVSEGVRKDWHSNLAFKALAQLQDDTSNNLIYKQIVINNYQKVIDYLKGQPNEREIAVIQISMSAAYIHNQELDSAKMVLNKALILLKQEKDIINEAKCLNNLAMCYAPKQPEMVRSLLLNADKLLIKYYKNKKNVNRTEIYSNLGNLDFDQKNYLKAAENYQIAIEQACSGNKDYIPQLAQQKVFNFNAPSQLRYPLKRKAEALFQQYLVDKKVENLVKSLKIYEALDDYITRTRGLMTADESKFAYSEKVVSVYENALLAAFTAFNLDHRKYGDYIIRFMGHSKAAVLQESAQQDTAKRFANLKPALVEAEKALRWEVAKAQKALSSSDDAHAPEASKNLLRATETWDVFIQRLETQYPIYYHAKYAGLKTLTVNQLQKKLTEDRAVIDFFWGQKTLYTTTMTQNHFEMDSLTITPVLQQQIKSWLGALHTYLIKDTIQKQLDTYSFLLYQQLLDKPLQRLPSQNKVQRFTIIPDGILNLLPFEALNQKPPQPKKWKKKDAIGTELIWKYAISYAYSNTLLFGAPPPKRKAPQDLGGFGINYKKKYVNEESAKKVSGRLIHAEKDVEKAKQIFPHSRIWTESAGNAHLENFYKNAPDCRILYLSMHGVLDDSMPLKSGLIFVRKDSVQMLQLSDIQGLPLPFNDLTILSACNTNLGKLSKGEGLISLSRAFSFTGARSLLATQWSLDEGTGSEIIESFLKYLKAGMPKDIALQKAKQDYLSADNLPSDRYAPNYWAATILVGEVDCLEPVSKPNRWWILLLLVGFFMVKWFVKMKIPFRRGCFI